MSDTNTSVGLWQGQVLHFGSLALLLVFAYLTWIVLGNPTPFAFWCAIALPIAHQVYVWLAWRLELRSATTSRVLGFNGYVVLFFVLFIGRFFSLFALAWLDRGSLGLDSSVAVLLATIFATPGLYAMYSVKRYFGMKRAAGADHFDERYQRMPLVNEGIFRFTDNGMYLYAFLLFWAIAVGLNSSAAVAVALFSHAYIWVHYFATEKPDMEYLYSAAER